MAGVNVLRGKKLISIENLSAATWRVMAKLQVSNTGDTLCDQAHQIVYPKIEFPVPCISKAIFASKQGEEDKVFSGLAKLQEEDPSISVEKNVETGETLVSAQGDLHLDVVKQQAGVQVRRERRDAGSAHSVPRDHQKNRQGAGRHKKQSGGHGQFGDVWIEFSPIGDTNIDFEFEDAVVGGVVPRNFIPSVEKGLRENIVKGVLGRLPDGWPARQAV